MHYNQLFKISKGIRKVPEMNQILERYAPKTYHTDIFESVNKILLTKADFRVCMYLGSKKIPTNSL